jgi:hypothetical protein
VRVTDPVAASTGLTTIVYVPFTGNVFVSMNPPLPP